MITKYYPFELLCQIVKNLKMHGNTIVFVHGRFDILHVGHLQMLYKAKKLGDVLVVGLDCDLIVKKIKGGNRPLRSFAERCLILSQIQTVDFIFQIECIDEMEDLEQIFGDIYKSLSPTILATSIGAGKHGEIKRKRAEAHNIKFVDVCTPTAHGATSRFIEKIKKNSE